VSETADPRDSRNAGKAWSERDVLRLRNLGLGSTPMRLIVRELGRPEDEVRAKAAEEGIELEVSGYNRLQANEEQR
jgi:hypothetical protein